MSKIIFSHGFGVRADSKGLFTDLSAGLSPDFDCQMVDLNLVDEIENTITVPPIKQQAVTLEAAIRATDIYVDIIAHSQGCLVAAHLPLGMRIRKIILLAPPVELRSSLMETTYNDHPQTLTTPMGMLQIVRKNGDRIWMRQDYIEEMRYTDPVKLINMLALKYPVTVFRATDDEMLDNIDDSALENVTVIPLPGDHDFDPPDRGRLIEAIKAELTQIK